MKQIILASSSPRRKEILKMIGLPFISCAADIDETVLNDEMVEDCVLRLSQLKAESVSGKFTDGLIIGSDTLVEATVDSESNTILGKPIDEKDAFRMLKILSGKKSIIYTGLCLMDIRSNKKELGFSKTTVFMKPFGEKNIRNYITTHEPMDKAGSYAIQGLGASLIEKIEGDFFNGVGLPVSLLVDMLKKFGIDIP